MDLTEAIYGRRATRRFTQEPVARSALEALVAAAMQAPSAVNEQPWDFAVVENAGLLDQMAAAAKAHMLEAMESNDFPRRLHENLDDPDFHVFYHAPVLIVISVRAGEWAVENAALLNNLFDSGAPINVRVRIPTVGYRVGPGVLTDLSDTVAIGSDANLMQSSITIDNAGAWPWTAGDPA